jgi:hypothetical protein
MRNTRDDDRRKGVTWAFLTAKQFRFAITEEANGMIWVDTGTNEIGCSDVWDFVGFMSETVKSRARS